MLRNLRLFLAIEIFCSATETHAFAPHVLSVAPESQFVSAAGDAEIVVTFDMPIDISTINGQTFRVFGKWSGPATGGFSFMNDNTEIHFLTDEKFFAGEMVMVQLTRGIQNTSGENIEQPYAWTYWIATAPGVLNQTAIDTIELRLSGEGLIETYGTYAGDMNNDGFSDLVAINEESDDVRVLINNGLGGYPNDFTLFDTGAEGTPSPHEAADFNNDGEIDLAIGTAWNNELRILTGNGFGSFSNLETYYTSNGVRGVAVGDFNGDGWDDILTTNRLDANISIFMNDGDGTFTISGMDVPDEDETACIATDINNDGLLDIFYAGYNSGTIGVLLGDGNGGFTHSVSIPVTGQPWMLATGDFNGDGNADVASANSSSNKTCVVIGDGLGGLGEPIHYSPANAQFTLAIDAGDLDGDDDLDLVTCNYSSANFIVFENTGNGLFSVAATLPSAEAGSCATLHDRDNDGDLDITGADEEVDVLFLFDNSGEANSAATLTKEDLQVAIYPNPASSTLSISIINNADKLTMVTVCDLSGKILAGYSHVSGNAAAIPLNGFEEGMYLLKMETKDGLTISSSFVISR